MKKRGIFITFEGPDGSGKSTQIELLKNYLNKKGYKALMTREPGGTRISELIRDIILDKDNTDMSYMTEAFLYAASRAQHVDQVIRPALNDGNVVISDRFVDSSIVYQGYGRNLGESVEIINNYAIRECIPDITFLFKLDPSIGIKRASGGVPDRIESEGIKYHKQVYNGYLELEKNNPDRICGIDASKSIDDIHKEIVDRINGLF